MDPNGYLSEEYFSSDEEEAEPRQYRQRPILGEDPPIIRQLDGRFSFVFLLLVIVVLKCFYNFVFRSHGGGLEIPGVHRTSGISIIKLPDEPENEV